MTDLDTNAAAPDETPEPNVAVPAATTDAGEETAPASESSEATTETPKEEPAKGYRKRIDQLTAQKHEERRAREAAESRTRELEERIARLEGTALVPPRPKINDFDSTEEFEEALEAHLVAKAQYTQPEAASTQQESPAASPEVQAAGERVSALGAVVAGSPEAFARAVLPAVQAGLFTDEVQLSLAEMETGAQIAMHLGQDADAAARVFKALDNPRALARELGRLEAEIAAGGGAERSAPPAANPTDDRPGPPPPANQTRSSQPFTPVSGATGGDRIPRDSDSFQVWREKRRAQRAAKRR
jgi:hypothetical protein